MCTFPFKIICFKSVNEVYIYLCAAKTRNWRRIVLFFLVILLCMIIINSPSNFNTISFMDNRNLILLIYSRRSDLSERSFRQDSSARRDLRTSTTYERKYIDNWRLIFWSNFQQWWRSNDLWWKLNFLVMSVGDNW